MCPELVDRLVAMLMTVITKLGGKAGIELKVCCKECAAFVMRMIAVEDWSNHFALRCPTQRSTISDLARC